MTRAQVILMASAAGLDVCSGLRSLTLISCGLSHVPLLRCGKTYWVLQRL